MSRAFFSLCLVLTMTPFVRAHPIPKNNRDRTIIVHLTPTAVVVEYRLEVDELTAFNELPRAERATLKNRDEIPPVFLPYFAAIFANNLDAKFDDKPLTFTCAAKSFKILDHQRYDYRFEAKWNPVPGKEHVFSLTERNYHDDSVSKLLLSMVGEDTLVIRRATAPDAALQAKAPEDLGPGDVDRLRNISATFVIEPESPLAAFKGGLPPDPGLDRAGPEEGQSVAFVKAPGAGESATGRDSSPSEPPAKAKSGLATREATGGSLLPDVPANPQAAKTSSHESWVLEVFLKSRSGLALALLLAAGFGAVHALTPGHGKTMVAAYLVGQRGTVWHALLLGLVTTVTHTAVVLILALVLWMYFGDQVPPGVDKVIGLVGGLMIAGLGLWLLSRRLAGRADHVHFGHGHSHGHSHGHGDHGHSHGHEDADHDHAGPQPALGIGPLIWLGIAGGILPCADAIGLLMLALKEGVPWLGPPLILAFSFGLASVLIGIGIGVVFTRRQLDARSGESARLRKLVRVLPLLSAVAVTALGLWMCYDSVHGAK